MNLDLNDEQKLIQETTRLVATTELATVSSPAEQAQEQQALIGNLSKLAALGFMGINVEQRYGGAEAGVIAFSVAMTEIARVCASTAISVSINNLACEVIQAIGTDAQKQLYIPKICSGEYSAGVIGLSEHCVQSSELCVTAEKEGDHYILNGARSIVQMPNAGVFIVWAVTEKTVPLNQGVSCFLVEAGTPGLLIAPEVKSSSRAMLGTSRLEFTECLVPQSALMGRLNNGFSISVAQLAGGRIGIGSMGLGIGLAAMKQVACTGTDCGCHGENASFQSVLEQLDATRAELEAARLLLMNAAYCRERGRNYTQKAVMAKVYAVKSANLACANTLELLERHGFGRNRDRGSDARITTVKANSHAMQRLILSWDILQGLAV
ncbi:MAG: acyl-CoA dehydrogenase family protein [Desulfobulbus sp.]|nr:acyl-CoA dehydrogenase family protein [Desulfobulbus sp.]